MPTLSSSIVKNRVASMRDVEEALARQVLYGGDLVTNLLELAAVSEAELTALLAESHGLVPAATGELPRGSESVLRLVPGELAQRHAFHPLEEQDGVLVIAVSDPLPPEVEEDLCFALGVQLEQRAAPVVRIRQAIARDYGLALDRRTLRLIAKLEGRPDPSPSSIPGPTHAAAQTVGLPRPASVPPVVHPPETGLSPPGAPAPQPPEPEPEPEPARTQTTEPPPPAPPPEKPAVAARDASKTLPSLRAPALPKSIAPARPAPGTEPQRKRSTPSLLPPAGDQETRPRRRRGPYTAAMAEEDLMKASSRDDVLRAFFDFSSQYFEYSALFAVQGDIAEGRDAHGPGTSAERISGIGVPLDLPSALSVAKNEASVRLYRLQDDGLDASLAKDLARPTGKQVMLLPIIVRGRCVLILYGDHGSADVSLAEVGDVLAFAPLVAVALERVILKRKRAARRDLADVAAVAPVSVRPRARAHPLPSPEQRVKALAAVLAPANAAAGGAPPPTAAPRTLAQSPAAKAASQATASSGPPNTASETPAAKTASPADASPAKRQPPPAPRRSPAPAIPRTVISGVTPGRRKQNTPPQGTPKRLDPELTGEPQPFPLTRLSPKPRALDSEPPEEDGWEPPLATEASFGSLAAPATPRGTSTPGMGTAAAAQRVVGDSRPARKLELIEAGGDSDAEIEFEESHELDDDVRDALAREEEAPLAPSSRSVAYGPRRLRPRQSAKELALPSVIIDIERDVGDLIARLWKSEPEACDRLVEIGEPAVSALVARFPGPITADRRRLSAEGTRASECGPLLATIARIGSAAIPFLVVRSADIEPEVRVWATRLLGEMPAMESARAVARRFLDSDENVRRAALAAGKLLQADEEARAALRDGLAQLASDATQPEEVRLAAIEALAEVRDPRSVPRLIPLVADKQPEVAKHAHWALGVLTRQDLGRDARAWHDWWRDNGHRHRIEWLIDALSHEQTEIRRAAGDELKAITKEYFGYYEDLPPRERDAAQKKYRDWWIASGKARFP